VSPRVEYICSVSSADAWVTILRSTDANLEVL